MMLSIRMYTLILLNGIIYYAFAGNSEQFKFEFSSDKSFQVCTLNREIKLKTYILPSEKRSDGLRLYINQEYNRLEHLHWNKYRKTLEFEEWQDNDMPEYLRKLHAHPYFNKKIFSLFIYKSEKQKDRYLESAYGVLKILEGIPHEIMVDGGNICTETQSFISGMDLKHYIYNPDTETEEPVNLSEFVRAMTCKTDGKMANIIYVTMENHVIHVYYKCNEDLSIQRQSFETESREKVHYNMVTKTKMNCKLRNDQDDERLESLKYCSNMQPYENPGRTNHIIYTTENPALHFELYFSYVCRFYSPLNIFENNGYSNVLQYQKFKISLGGYMELNKNRPFVGLVYEIMPWPETNLQNNPEFSFYDSQEP